MVNGRQVDPSTSMATWDSDGEDGLCGEDDGNIEATKSAVVNRANQEPVNYLIDLINFVGNMQKSYQARMDILTDENLKN